MPYLIAKDLSKQIQSENLAQISGGDAMVLEATQRLAEEEAKSYLLQKYDLSLEMRDVSIWDRSVTTYKPEQNVYLDASAYLTTTSYANGSLCLYASNVYLCITATTGTFDPTKWRLMGRQYDMFSVSMPAPAFEFNALYNTGDKVYWQGCIYKAILPTQLDSHQQVLQYGTYANVPYLNYAPTSNSGKNFWEYVSTFNFPAYVSVTDTNYWTAGDGRSQQLVAVIVDIALYHLHSRISPRNIPELRVKRYDDAIKWLKKCATGEVTPNVPALQPLQGNRIRYGGSVKNTNTY